MLEDWINKIFHIIRLQDDSKSSIYEFIYEFIFMIYEFIIYDLWY